MNLLPDIKGPLLMSFKLPEGKKNSAVTLEISVNSQYTSTLKITQTNSSIIPFKDIQLEVLIYHDFKMVEVKKFNKKYSYRTPLNIMYRADDLVGIMLFLMSDASSYATGQNFIIDGGYTAW